MKRPQGRNWKFRLSAQVLQVLFDTMFRVEIKGLENLPQTGPAILVSNHRSYLDVLLIGKALQERGKELKYRTHWVMGKTTYRNPYLHWLFSIAPVIRINGTVQKAEQILREGDFVVIFPEGFYTWHKYDFSRAGKKVDLKRKFGKSASVLSFKTGFPVVPIRLRGTEEVMPPYSFFPKPGKLGIVIGEPLLLPSLGAENLNDAMIDERIRLIMSRVDGLQ